MTTFDFGAVLLIMAVAIDLLNERLFRLPRPVALLLGSFVILSIIVALDVALGEGMRAHLRERITHAHLPDILLNGLVALLLFAGGLSVDLPDLRRRAFPVLILATGSVVLATLLFAVGIWAVSKLIGETLPAGWCFTIGAILAPTDALTVEGLLAKATLPPGLRAIISGESLFNDGAAVVLFSTALALMNGQTDMVWHGQVAKAIAIEGGGGVLIGIAAGYLGSRIVRLTRDDHLAMLITLALALSVYRAAVGLSLSGPVAVVVAGIVLGLALKQYAREAHGQVLFMFWPLVEATLNTLLYLLMGFEILVIKIHPNALLAVGLAVPLALAARFLSVAGPLLVLRIPDLARVSGILTWAGLRGSITIALALILPHAEYRDFAVTICFGVVIFTMTVQGLSLPWVIAALSRGRETEQSTA
jgi:CPA1 family monovalent cation:H+ antiporter